MRPVDLTGHRSGRLVARTPTDERTRNGAVIWLCDCDCGTKGHPVPAYHLTGKTRRQRWESCGCLRSEVSRCLGAATGATNLAGHKAAATGTATCPACRQEFDRRGRQVYCSEECRLRRVDADPGPDRCAYCDGTMDRRGYARRYCSMQCKRLAARAAAKARIAEAKRVSAAEHD